MKKSQHIIYGKHAAMAAIVNPMRKIKSVLVTKNTHSDLTALHGKKCFSGCKNVTVTESGKLDSKLPREAVHQGIVVECDPLSQPHLQEWLAAAGHDKPLVVLDQVNDPHNIGAILRSAAAFDVGAVIVTDKNSPSENGVMAKAASGALEVIPLISVVNVRQSIDMLKKNKYWVYGLDGNASQNVSDVKFDTKTALVLGAEGKGLRRLTAENCDMLVTLPMSNKMESLNVSNAAAVALYELHRQLS